MPTISSKNCIKKWSVCKTWALRWHFPLSKWTMLFVSVYFFNYLCYFLFACVWACVLINSFRQPFFQDLVKSHLMYAVREEVEVLKEHIKELYERNSVLERENAVLKSLANSEQLGQLTSQLAQGSSSSTSPPLQQQQHPLVTNNNNNTPLSQPEGNQSVRHQPNITSAWFPFPQDTCSKTHHSRTAVEDPVSKVNNCYRPCSSFKQKARISIF